MIITTLQSGLLTWFFTPFMLCVFTLYISGGSYNFQYTPNDKFFEKLFMAILFIFKVFARNLLRENSRRKILYFWALNPDFKSNTIPNRLRRLRIYTYSNIMELRTYIQCLKYSSYSSLTTRMMLLLISTLHNSHHIYECHNKYESQTLG